MMFLCSLYSGSSGNSTVIGDSKTKILLDCGMSGTYITASMKKAGLNVEELDAIIITHEHTDHIRSAGVLSRKFDLPIFASEGTWEGMGPSIGKIAEKNIKIIPKNRVFGIKSITLKAFDLPHDANEPLGYCFFSGNHKIAVATDLGHVHKELFDHIAKSDIVMLESNHDINMLINGPYPYHLKKRIASKIGHLPNHIAAKVCARLLESGTKKILLAHLSKENNRPELAYGAAYAEFTATGAKVGYDILLSVAPRYENCFIPV